MDAEDQVDADAAGRTQISRKAFLDRVIERSGHARRTEARAVVEAALATLGEMLAGGADINLAPLGKLRMVKEKSTDRARILSLRLSIPKGDRGTRGESAVETATGAETGAGALADPDEAE